MSIALDASGECLTPTSFAEATVRGFLWCRPGKGGAWKRRYAICCANFVLWFPEKEAERPSKPVGALCFEDLVVEPHSTPPTEKEVATFGTNAFSVLPPDQAKSGTSVFSSATGRRYQFCAESEAEEVVWRTALTVWRHSALVDDRHELARVREATYRAEKRHQAALDDLHTQLDAAKQEAVDQCSMAEAAQQQATLLREELQALDAALLEARQALRRSDSEKAEAVKTARKMQITNALFRASRDTLQKRVEEMEEELAVAAAQQARTHSYREEESARADPTASLRQDGAQTGRRNLFGAGGIKKAAFVPDEESERIASAEGLRPPPLPPSDRKGSMFGGSKGGERKGSVMIGARKGSVFMSADDDLPVEEGRPPSDVDEETAVALLARTQECSAHFTDFSADELVTLARTLAVLHFKADETILFQGEPATFFAVVLEGALAPIVDGTALKDNARGVGELVGELALFHGGTRQASLVATADGVLAAFQFDELERLRASADHAACEVGKKLNLQLARAALAKRLEAEGKSLASLSDADLQERLVELRLKQAEQKWIERAKLGGEARKQESLFKRKLNSATKKVRKQSAHAMAIGAKAGAATARVAGATGRAAVGAAKVGFSLPSHAIEKEEIDLSPEVLALEAPSGPGKHGVWKEGMLRKRPPVKMSNKFVPGRSLQPRQCVLKSDGLYYYSEGGKGLEEARGKIPLIAMRAILLSRTPDGPQIEISVGTRVFAFVGADDACAYSWRLAIDAAKGYKGAAASKRMRERATSRAQRGDLAAKVVLSSKLDGNRTHRQSSYAMGHGQVVEPEPQVGTEGNPRRSSAASREQELLAGWLQKQDHQKWSSKFKPRYFVLTPSSFQYFRDETRDELLQTVELPRILEVFAALERSLSKFEGELHVKTAERTFKLLAETHEQMRKWVKAITKARSDALKAAAAELIHAPGRRNSGGFAGVFAARARANSKGNPSSPNSLQSPATDVLMEEDEEDDGWTEQAATEADVTAVVLRRVNIKFRAASIAAQQAAVAAAAETGAENLNSSEAVASATSASEIGPLLSAADEVVSEMLASADDFRYSEPPRLPLFERCVREFHTQLYSNLAHLFHNVEDLKPMDTLQLLAWLEEYRERLALADAPPLQPPLLEVQRGLISAFAAQSRETWEVWATNLHQGEISAIGRGEIENCSPPSSPGLACTPAPVDLLSFLNAPFGSLKGLQVPALTNALVTVCANVVVTYARLQREFVHMMGSAVVRGGGGMGDASLAAAGVCAVANNAERTIEMLDRIGDHIDEGVEDDELDDDGEDEESAAERSALVGDDAARDGLRRAETELASIAPSAVHALAVIATYRPCAGSNASPLLARELAALEPPPAWFDTLKRAHAAIIWLGSKLHASQVPSLERASLSLCVGHAIEALLCSKSGLLVESQSAVATQAVHALEQFAGALASMDTRTREGMLAPLRLLLRLGTCDMNTFRDTFAELQSMCAEVGLPVAEALLMKRGYAKGELRELLSQFGPRSDSSLPNCSSEHDAWAPPEVAPLAGQPFGLACARLAGSGNAGWKTLKTFVKKK